MRLVAAWRQSDETMLLVIFSYVLEAVQAAHFWRRRCANKASLGTACGVLLWASLLSYAYFA